MARFRRRGLALLLAMVMVVSLLQVSAFAAEGEDTQDPEMVEVEIPLEGDKTVVDDAAEPDGETDPDDAAEPDGETDPDDAAEPDGETDPDDAAEPDGETVPEEGNAAAGAEPVEEQPAIVEIPEIVEELVWEYDTIRTVADDDAEITVSGLMPKGSYVTAKSVEITLEDLTVLAAYDITIYDSEGDEWQPDESVTVEIQNPALADVEDVEIYHMEDEDAEPEHVDTITTDEDVATFEAESFSIYVVAANRPSWEWSQIDDGNKEFRGGQVISLYSDSGHSKHHWEITEGKNAAEITGNSKWATLTLKEVERDTRVTIKHSYKGILFSGEEEATITVKASKGTQTVYVYVDARDVQTGTGGFINENGYFTIGTIEMQLPDPEKSYAGNGEARYKTYEDAVKRALGGINHMYNTWVDLDDVDWYTLHTADGADIASGQVFVPSGQYAWHLDGRISEVPTLYKVTYHANNGTQATYPNPNMYEENAEVLVLGNETTGFQNEGKVFLGWSTTPNGTVDSDYTVGETFVIRDNVDLYAVWGDELPTTGTLTVTKTVSGHALPENFHILVKNSSNQVVYTLGLTNGTGVTGPDANTTYTWTLSDVAPGTYTVTEENALINEYDLEASSNPAVVYVQAGKNASIQVTNTYTDASGETASFTIKKVEKGTNTGLEGAEFHLCQNENCTGSCKNGITWTTDKDGLANFTGLTSDTYYLRETKAPDGYKLGSTVYKIKVGGQHEKQTAGGNIFTYLWELIAGVPEPQAQKDESGHILIPNEKQSGTLKVTKTYTGVNALPGSFMIEVAASDGTKQLLSFENVKTCKTGCYEWELPLPVGSYTVSETGYEKAGYDVSIGVDERQNVTKPSTTVVVTEGDTTSLTFQNAYTSTTPAPIEPVTITFSGLKDLDGTRTDVPQFTFYLKSYVKNISDPLTEPSELVSEVTNDAYGRIFFDTQTFESAGTYWYQVAEKIPSLDDGYRYDTTVYYIEVVVTENDGALTANETFYTNVESNGKSELVKADAILFHNETVEPEPVPETVDLSFQYVTNVSGASDVPSGVTAPATQELAKDSVFGTHAYGTGSYSSDYTFHGWYEDPACTVRMAADAILSSDTTVYGYWTYDDGDDGGDDRDDDDDDDDHGTNIPDDDTPTTNLPDEGTPTTDLPDEGTPTTDLPDEGTPTTDLPDGETPMAEAPKTGDTSLVWVLAAAASGAGLVWLAVSGMKRKDHDA